MSLNPIHQIRYWTQKFICGAKQAKPNMTTTSDEDECYLEAWSRRASMEPAPTRIVQSPVRKRAE